MIDLQREAARRRSGQDVSRSKFASDGRGVAQQNVPLRAVEDWVGEHPVLCIALALFTGVSVGWLIKRK